MLNRRMLLRCLAAAPWLAQAQDRLALPAGKIRCVLDTDTYNEIDDQFAVAYAMLSPEHMSVEAVYAAPFLNDRSKDAGDGMRQSYEEILRILAILKARPERFAFRGSERFLPAAGKPVESDAARDLIDKAMKSTGAPLYVLTVGAPTNVSSALLMEPRLKEKIVVVWLGGQPYDWTSAKEFNLQQDLHASRVLYDSGVPLLNVPTTNVSEHLRTTDAEMAAFLKGRGRLADYLYNQFHKYAEKYRRSPNYPYSKVIWDIAVIAWMIEPKWISSKVVPSPLLQDDLTWRAGSSRHPVRVATRVNRDAVFADLFQKLVKHGSMRQA